MPLSDIERYAAAYAHCLRKAESIRVLEIAAFWFNIAGSYKFLFEREGRFLGNEKTIRFREFSRGAEPLLAQFERPAEADRDRKVCAGYSTSWTIANTATTAHNSRTVITRTVVIRTMGTKDAPVAVVCGRGKDVGGSGNARINSRNVSVYSAISAESGQD